MTGADHLTVNKKRKAIVQAVPISRPKSTAPLALPAAVEERQLVRRSGGSGDARDPPNAHNPLPIAERGDRRMLCGTEEELFGKSPPRSSALLEAPSSGNESSADTADICSQGSTGSKSTGDNRVSEILEQNHREVHDLASQALSIRDTLSVEQQGIWDAMFHHDRECVNAMFNMQKMRSDLLQNIAGKLLTVTDELVRVRSDLATTHERKAAVDKDLQTVKERNTELEKEAAKYESKRKQLMELAKDL